MNAFTKILSWLLARAKEPSTYAGTGALALVVLHVFPGALGAQVLAVLSSIGGLLAIVLPETK